MADARKSFPTKYLSPVDLTGKNGEFISQTVTIRSWNEVSMWLQDGSSGLKPVLYFEGKQKGLVLNKTNNKTLMKFFGWDTDK